MALMVYVPVDCWQVTSFFCDVLFTSCATLSLDNVLESERLRVPLSSFHWIIAEERIIMTSRSTTKLFIVFDFKSL